MADARPKRRSACVLAQAYYAVGCGVAREAEALSGDGFDVHVVCLRGDGEAAREAIGGVSVHRVARAREGPPGFARYALNANVFFIRASFALLRLHLAHRFDVIQVDNPPDSLVFAALVPRLSGTRVVLRLREPAPELFAGAFGDRWYTRALMGLHRMVQRSALAFAHRSIATGREIREACARSGADVNAISTIVDVPGDASLAADLRERHRETIASVKKDERRRGVFRVFYHGALERGRALETLLGAVARLGDDVPGIEVRVTGALGMAAMLPSLAAELGAKGRIHALGDLSSEALAGEIFTADVAVVPTPSTAYTALVVPREVFEYAALGCVVVASRLPALMSYFPEEALVYFSPGDADDLAGKLHTVFAQPEETPARVAAATKIVEAYRWEREKKKYLSVFHKLVAEPGATGPAAPWGR